jgi:hypothetical protein
MSAYLDTWFRNGDRDFRHELFYTEYIPRIDSALSVPYSKKTVFALFRSPTIFANPTTRSIIVALGLDVPLQLQQRADEVIE